MTDTSYLHYIVAEYQILREMFFNPALSLDYQRDIFFHEEAMAVYDAIRLLYEKNGKISQEDVLREANALNENVTYDTIEKVTTVEKSVTSIEDLIKSARESAILLQVKSKFADLTAKITEKKIDDKVSSGEWKVYTAEELRDETNKKD